MFKVLTTILAITLSLTFCHSLALAEDSNPPFGLKVVDLVVIRPVSAGVATISTAFFVVTSPLTFVFGVAEPAARILVEAPWRFTGLRYLGDFEQYKDGKHITAVTEK